MRMKQQLSEKFPNINAQTHFSTKGDNLLNEEDKHLNFQPDPGGSMTVVPL